MDDVGTTHNHHFRLAASVVLNCLSLFNPAPSYEMPDMVVRVRRYVCRAGAIIFEDCLFTCNPVTSDFVSVEIENVMRSATVDIRANPVVVAACPRSIAYCTNKNSQKDDSGKVVMAGDKIEGTYLHRRVGLLLPVINFGSFALCRVPEGTVSRQNADQGRRYQLVSPGIGQVNRGLAHGRGFRRSSQRRVFRRPVQILQGNFRIAQSRGEDQLLEKRVGG